MAVALAPSRFPLPQRRRQIDTLVVAMDYSGSCRGTCPTCVLSLEERRSDRPLIMPGVVRPTLDELGGLYLVEEELIVTLGRGNNLLLDEATIDDFLEIGAAACAALPAPKAILEISTSLIGKLELQIARACRIIDRFATAGLSIRPYFQVVGNTALSSPSYWRNIDAFLTATQAHRGGERDGNGDIMQLNVGIASLPDIDWLEGFVRDYKFPVNVLWVPTFDPDARDEAAIERLALWLEQFYLMAARCGLDSNIVNRSRMAVADAEAGRDALVERIAGGAGSLVYITPDGAWHEGFMGILAEMDPVRFDPDAARIDGQHRMVDDPRRELGRLLRNRACRSCAHLARCVAGGTYKTALLTLRRHPRGTSVCPSAMARVFERVTHA